MKLSLILEAVDRSSGALRKVAAATRGLAKDGNQLDRAMRATATGGGKALDNRVISTSRGLTGMIDRARGAGRAIVSLGTSAGRLKAVERAAYGVGFAFGRAGREAATFAGRDLGLVRRSLAATDRAGSQFLMGMPARFDRAAAGARRLGHAIGYGIGYSAGVAARKLAGMTLQIARAAAGWGVLGATAAAGWFTKGVISTASSFEQYQVALEGTEGSAIKAKAAMSWVAKFAKNTPYDIETVTDAFVRARGVGLDPLTGAFRILGDAAGGTRKSLMDAVEAIADAQTGEFERLKEFNITTSVKGDVATFSYIDKAGKQAKKTVKKDMKEIQGAILAVFDAKYGGGMERQSKTFSGILSNIGDAFTNFQLRIAGAGFFDKVKSRLQGILAWIDKLDKEGKLDAWAKRAGDEMGRLFDRSIDFITKTDWAAVATGIGTIVSVLGNVITLIGNAATAWSQWQRDVERRQLNMVVSNNGWFGPSAQEKEAARKRLAAMDREEAVPKNRAQLAATANDKGWWGTGLGMPTADDQQRARRALQQQDQRKANPNLPKAWAAAGAAVPPSLQPPRSRARPPQAPTDRRPSPRRGAFQSVTPARSAPVKTSPPSATPPVSRAWQRAIAAPAPQPAWSRAPAPAKAPAWQRSGAKARAAPQPEVKVTIAQPPMPKPVDGKVKVEVTLVGAPAAGARTSISSNSRQVSASVTTPGRRGAAMGPAA